MSPTIGLVDPARFQVMGDVDVLDRVRTLRAKGSSPKEIARALGLPPAQVTPLIKAIAAETVTEAKVVGCWVSPGWSQGLTVECRAWPDVPDEPGREGVVLAIVARSARHGRVTACGYLVDVFCLGVKNALGPRRIDDGRGLRDFHDSYFARYGHRSVEAPLELVQHLVLGAVDFARRLGFEPHPDFAAARGHLGDWDGPSDITFGRGGRPLYIQGPYDDPARVVATLKRTAGRGNFDFVSML